jgi:hypothetical protein
MKKSAFLTVATLLVLAACSSQPTSGRPSVDRGMDSPRPEGVVPDGLAEQRAILADQRATTREQENAVNFSPNTLTTNPESNWFDSTLSTLADVLHFIRNF